MYLWTSLMPVQATGASSLLGDDVNSIIFSLKEILNSLLGFLSTVLAGRGVATVPAGL